MRPKVRTWLCLAATIAILTYIYVQMTVKSRLIHRAMLVADTTAWDLETTRKSLRGAEFLPIQSSYSWLSENEVAYFRNVTFNPYRRWPPDAMQDIWSPGRRGGMLATYNLVTHRERELQGLTREFLETNGAADTVLFSTDRQNALWYGRQQLTAFSRNADSRLRAHVARVDGSERADYPTSQVAGIIHPFQVFLARDRVFEVRPGLGTAGWYDPAHPNEHAPTIKIVGECSRPAFAHARTGDLLLYTNWRWGAPHDSRSLLVTSIALGSRNPAATSRPVVLPPNYELLDFAFSPTGDKILWLLTMRNVPPVLAFLHRYAPLIPAPPHFAYALWVSNTDGSRMHELGDVDAPRPDGPPELFYIRWLPDGNRVSFVYHHGLYIVPDTTA